MKALQSVSQTSIKTTFETFGAHRTRPLVGTLGNAETALTRVGLGQDPGQLSVAFPSQDAFYVVFQLRDQPAHEYWVDGRVRVAPPAARGCLHIADLNAPHAAVLTSRFDSINMLIPRAFLDALADDCGARRVHSLAAEAPWQLPDSRLASMAPALLDAIDDPSDPGPLFSDHLTTAVALYIAERYGGLRRPILRRGGLTPRQQRRACELIAADLAKETPLATVAAECGLSVSHFARAFKASLGLTPHGWLQAQRIETAKHLIAVPDMPLAAIAIRCGFADQSHLTRVFKRATGVTPAAWRRMR